MGLCEYESAERRAETGDAEAIAQVMKVAVGNCECRRPCFVRRRACETLERQGIHVVRKGARRR